MTMKNREIVVSALFLIATLASGCVCRHAAGGNPTTLLVPAARQVACRSGHVPADAPVKTVAGEIAEAPATVRDQAYRLEITPGGITITASGRAGERYANTTLAQLKKLSCDGGLPVCTITDWPALRYRGFMNDYGRNYQSLESIRQTLDLMAAYKMNLFHWHLTDYHGWRLESRKYPQLNRPEAMKRHIGKYYTQKEFVEIVEYAAERGITVVPELDVPGHSEAFRKGMGIKKMHTPGVDKTVCDLIDELCSLVPAEKMPYVHIGTDEVCRKKEKVPDAWYQLWAAQVCRNGRTVISWWPGHALKPENLAVVMVWGQKGVATNTPHPYLDTTKSYYLNHMEPFEILRGAAYQQPCRWGADDPRALGALISVWHDDIAPSTEDLWNHIAIAPGIVMLSDAYWCGREKQRTDLLARAPEADDPDAPLQEELELRVIAQRDRVLRGFPRPFQYVRQSDMRWRVTDEESGEVLAEALAGAVITPHHWLFKQAEFRQLAKKPTGTVSAETWIYSDRDRECGAWIGFTGFSRSGGRKSDKRLPASGEWSRHGATVTLNGKKIKPPEWGNPGAKVVSYETPFTNEEYYFRPPTPIRLAKGWNHVKLHMPKKDTAGRWTATFAPVLGDSARPREVPGLKYSSTPPAGN